MRTVKRMAWWLGLIVYVTIEPVLYGLLVIAVILILLNVPRPLSSQ